MIDDSKTVDEIRAKLESVRTAYLRGGVIIGFVCWLMWIPVAVAIGFDMVVLYPNSLIPSLVVGVIGFGASVWNYYRVLGLDSKTHESTKQVLSGRSLNAAFNTLPSTRSTKSNKPR